MGGSEIRSVLFSMMGLLLTACASDANKEPDPNIFPAAYKQEILDLLAGTLPDPTNVHDAFVSEPVLATVGKEPRYTICLRYNARDVYRQYSGSQDRLGIFYAGHLNQLIEAGKDQCAKAAYRPFPELEKLCFAKKCE
jgi:hypothetical protein